MFCGSPPRVWGKHLPHKAPTDQSPGSPPRVWGKRIPRQPIADNSIGSPPRVWGKRNLVRRRSSYVIRFTPTCVGKTPTELSAVIRSHGSPPRVWGKLSAFIASRIASPGSPPRVWGKRDYCGHSVLLLRFTPTCVGKTFCPVSCCKPSVGSPPRVWGKRRTTRLPTRLGSVHPHVCGENPFHQSACSAFLRFTPTCVGKTHPIKLGLLNHDRFTPTCVGKTHDPHH